MIFEIFIIAFIIFLFHIPLVHFYEKDKKERYMLNKNLDMNRNEIPLINRKQRTILLVFLGLVSVGVICDMGLSIFSIGVIILVISCPLHMICFEIDREHQLERENRYKNKRVETQENFNIVENFNRKYLADYKKSKQSGEFCEIHNIYYNGFIPICPECVKKHQEKLETEFNESCFKENPDASF